MLHIRIHTLLHHPFFPPTTLHRLLAKLEAGVDPKPAGLLFKLVPLPRPHVRRRYVIANRQRQARHHRPEIPINGITRPPKLIKRLRPSLTYNASDKGCSPPSTFIKKPSAIIVLTNEGTSDENCLVTVAKTECSHPGPFLLEVLADQEFPPSSACKFNIPGGARVLSLKS